MLTKRHNKRVPVLPTSVEFLLDNILDDEVQRIFYPLQIFSNLFFSSKYYLRDNFVTPNGKKHYVIALLAQLAFLVCVVCRVYLNVPFSNNTEKNNRESIFKLGLGSYHYFGFTYIVFLNVYNGSKNTSFILRIQSISKCINISGKTKYIVFWNWVTIWVVLGIDLTTTTFFCTVVQISFFTFMYEIFRITIDVNLVYAIRCINLLRIYLDKWNDDISGLDDEEKYSRTDFKTYFIGYNHVIEAYRLYKTIFQAVITFHIIDTFLLTLLYVSIVIQMSRMQEPVQVESMNRLSVISILTVLTCVKDLFLIFIQCYETDEFYKAADQAKSMCILRTKSETFSDNEKALYKNVLQTDRVFLSKFIACGLFAIDAVLPLQMAGVLTNYVIILLQFNLLD